MLLIYLWTCCLLSIPLFFCLSVHLYIYLSIYLPRYCSYGVLEYLLRNNTGICWNSWPLNLCKQNRHTLKRYCIYINKWNCKINSSKYLLWERSYYNIWWELLGYNTLKAYISIKSPTFGPDFDPLRLDSTSTFLGLIRARPCRLNKWVIGFVTHFDAASDQG